MLICFHFPTKKVVYMISLENSLILCMQILMFFLIFSTLDWSMCCHKIHHEEESSKIPGPVDQGNCNIKRTDRTTP